MEESLKLKDKLFDYLTDHFGNIEIFKTNPIKQVKDEIKQFFKKIQTNDKIKSVKNKQINLFTYLNSNPKSKSEISGKNKVGIKNTFKSPHPHKMCRQNTLNNKTFSKIKFDNNKIYYCKTYTKHEKIFFDHRDSMKKYNPIIKNYEEYVKSKSKFKSHTPEIGVETNNNIYNNNEKNKFDNNEKICKNYGNNKINKVWNITKDSNNSSIGNISTIFNTPINIFNNYNNLDTQIKFTLKTSIINLNKKTNIPIKVMSNLPEIAKSNQNQSPLVQAKEKSDNFIYNKSNNFSFDLGYGNVFLRTDDEYRDTRDKSRKAKKEAIASNATITSVLSIASITNSKSNTKEKNVKTKKPMNSNHFRLANKSLKPNKRLPLLPRISKRLSIIQELKIGSQEESGSIKSKINLKLI